MKNEKLELIKQMLIMQDEFNSVVDPEWTKAGFAWNRAIWLESAELVESLPWKWWKNAELDIKNIIVETVDIWHFVMSEQMAIYGTENINMLAKLLYEKIFKDLDDTPVFDANKLVIAVEELVVCSADNKLRLYPVSQLLKHAGFNLDILFREYMIKNTLNSFRQENGYKDGIYIKQWLWSGSTAEDNLVVNSLAEHIKLDENFGANLKKAMKHEYKRTVDANK